MHSEKVAFLQKELKKKGLIVLEPRRESNIIRPPIYKKKVAKISLSTFTEIIDINSTCAIVEPQVTFDKLVKETLLLGLVPPVVPEFKGITVGGAFAGTSLESSSGVYGQFSDTVLGLTVLLGNGEIIGVSRTENSDLFWGLSGSYGTLGIILSLIIQLIPAKKNIHIGIPGPFEETLIIGNEKIHLTAAMTDSPANFFTGPFSKWFYKRVPERQNFILPLYDYLFRYDRGAFWMASTFQGPSWLLYYFFHIKKELSFKKAWEAPFFFRPFFSSKRLYKTLHQLPSPWFEKNFIVQDFYIPLSKLDIFLKEIVLRPLWICPIKPTSTPQIFSPHYLPCDKLVDVGVYGIDLEASTTSKRLEKICYELKGRKMLYAYNYYSLESFWEIYNEKAYRCLRTKYYADKTFLSIEKKVLSR